MLKCCCTSVIRKEESVKPSRSTARRASGWCDLAVARVARVSCDAAPTMRQFSRGRPTMGSRVVGGQESPTKVAAHGSSSIGSGHLLETNFWDSEESEDEGIGSDDSVEQADMSPSGESPVKSFNWGVDSRKSTGRRKGMGGLLTQIKKSLQGKTEVIGMVFGVGLGELVNSEGGKVPRLVSWATELIEGRGAEAWEGIYRLSGQSSTVASLRAAIDAGKQPSEAHTASTHSVAAMLKVCATNSSLYFFNVSCSFSFASFPNPFAPTLCTEPLFVLSASALGRERRFQVCLRGCPLLTWPPLHTSCATSTTSPSPPPALA